MEDPSPGGDGKKLEVIAPGPPATTDQENGQHRGVIPRVVDEVTAILFTTPSVHNWVELVYQAFLDQPMPTGAKEVALLGLRTGRSRPSHRPGTPRTPAPPPSSADADAAVLNREKSRAKVADDRTRTAVDTGDDGLVEYGDLLYVAFTPNDVHRQQNVEVFECVIDATKLSVPDEVDKDFQDALARVDGIMHPADSDFTSTVVGNARREWESVAAWPLPDLLEGKLFHARRAPYLPTTHPGDVVLRVKTDDRKPDIRPEDVVRIAEAELADWRAHGNGGKKYRMWYYNRDTEDSWCGMFVSKVMDQAGMPIIRYMWVPDAVTGFQSGTWGTWITAGADMPEPGDVIIYNVVGSSSTECWDHTGLTVAVSDLTTVTAIDGNTSVNSQPKGSESDGNGVEKKTRSGAILAGFGRPRYAPIIRWGGDRQQVDNRSRVGQTVLHHHYFVKDGKGGWKVDKASRYQTLLDVVAAAPAENRKNIPYLVVSTKYVLTYEEWAELVTKDRTKLIGDAKVQSVIRTSGLESPAGMPGKYLPSFIKKSDADHLLQAEHDAIHASAPPNETEAQRKVRGRRKRNLQNKRRDLESALFQLTFTPSR